MIRDREKWSIYLDDSLAVIEKKIWKRHFKHRTLTFILIAFLYLDVMEIWKLVKSFVTIVICWKQLISSCIFFLYIASSNGVFLRTLWINYIIADCLLSTDQPGLFRDLHILVINIRTKSELNIWSPPIGHKRSFFTLCMNMKIWKYQT